MDGRALADRGIDSQNESRQTGTLSSLVCESVLPKQGVFSNRGNRGAPEVDLVQRNAVEQSSSKPVKFQTPLQTASETRLQPRTIEKRRNRHLRLSVTPCMPTALSLKALLHFPRFLADADDVEGA